MFFHKESNFFKLTKKNLDLITGGLRSSIPPEASTSQEIE